MLHGKTIIYEAYNNEYELMKSSFSHSILGKFLLYYVRHLEKGLSKRSDLIFTVSMEDKNSLCKIYDIKREKIALSPNGIPVSYYDIVLHNRKRNPCQPICVFIGSYHPPNIEAIGHIVDIASQVPDIVFFVIGGASQYYINHDAMVEPCTICSKDIFSNQPSITLSNGFYALERWDDTPIIWTKPEWIMLVGEGVEEVSVTLYSPSEQAMTVTGEGIEKNTYNLTPGWNTISIEILGSQENSLRFICEKKLIDSGRVLGVAVKELQYCNGENQNILDITNSIRQVFRFKQAPNVHLLGQISEEEKFAIYRTADVALNPMTSGSGTNIKVLGYLASGVPLVTTPKGARGLALINGENALICDISDFPEKIKDILKDSHLAAAIAHNGRELVEETYDWSIITNGMAEKINEMLPDE
jgi:glycosyltransferase involved in cell wall biosynthesis